MIAARLTDDSWYGRDLWWTLLVIKIPKPYWLHFWDDPTPNNTTTKETEHG